MIVTLNIVSPLMILSLILIVFKSVRFNRLKKIIGGLGVVLWLVSAPLVLSDLCYYNGVLEYFKITVALISTSLIISLFIGAKYFKPSLISLLCLAFLLNLSYQFIVQLAGMGGTWESNNIRHSSFPPPLASFENYNIVNGSGFFIHETICSGLIYREIAHKLELEKECITTFELYNQDRSICYDSCLNELSLIE